MLKQVKDIRLSSNILFVFLLIFYFYSHRSYTSKDFKPIGGDGFGYYAYTPALYKYDDYHLKFKWFQKVYDTHYTPRANAKDHFIPKSPDKQLNKYYPGLSLVFTPFYFIADVAAKNLGFEADGFSEPYQFMITVAVFLALITGIFYQQKLLDSLFGKNLINTFIPIGIALGGNLIHFSIANNSHTHPFSIAFLSMALYFAKNYTVSKSLKELAKIMAVSSLIITIRPINLVLLLPLFLFIPFTVETWKNCCRMFLKHWLFVFFTILILTYFVSINYIQTGTFLSNNYSREAFYFNHSLIWNVFFGARIGLFFYSPIVILAIVGLLFLKKWNQKIMLFSQTLLFCFLYSCWWYWLIFPRVILDLFPYFAIGIGALYYRIHQVKIRVVFSLFCILLISFGFMKQLQIDRGVLSNSLEYWESYKTNFWEFEKRRQIKINPRSIIQKQLYEDTSTISLASNGFGKNKIIQVPEIKFTTTAKFFTIEAEMNAPVANETMQIVIKGENNKKQLIFSNTCYASFTNVKKNNFHLFEFCISLDKSLVCKTDIISVYFWNPSKKAPILVRNVKFGFYEVKNFYDLLDLKLLAHGTPTL